MRQKNPGSNIFVDSRNFLRLKYFGMENLNKMYTSKFNTLTKSQKKDILLGVKT